jgi:hypothetical protein
MSDDRFKTKGQYPKLSIDRFKKQVRNLYCWLTDQISDRCPAMVVSQTNQPAPMNRLLNSSTHEGYPTVQKQQ